MDVILDSVTKSSISMGHTPIFTAICKENSSSILKKNSIIIVTDYGLDIYSAAKGNLRTTLSWIAISKVGIKNNDISLKFSSKSVSISTELYASKLFGAIVHCLQQLLSSFEIQLLQIDKFNVPKAKHSGYGALLRFSELARSNGKLISPESLEKLKNVLMISKKEVDLSILGDLPTTFPIFLGTLPLISTIQSLNIPQIPMFPTYQVLSDYAASIARLNYVDIAGQVSELFKLFLTKLSNMQNSKLLGLSFTNSDFTVEYLSLLSNFISTQKISAIGFHNAIIYDAMPHFYSNFFTSTMVDSLTVLNLDNTKNLDIQKLFPSLKNIYILSLENCNLYIDKVFSQMEISGFRNIRALNISNNLCEHLPTTAISLPQTLISIVANNIRWNDLCLLNMLKIVFSKRRNNTKLSLSYANASPDEWQRVWQFFSTCNYDNLISFTWDGNPVNVSLFSFLLINQQLEFLSMSDIFSQNEPNTVTIFSRYLEKTESLKFLILKGGNQKYLGRLIGAITRVTNLRKSLIHLDISNNKIGDIGLDQIKPLYTQKTELKMINFDGSSPTSKDSMLNILYLAAQNLEQTHTSFPIKDMNMMKDTSMISNEIYNTMLTKFQKAPKLNGVPYGEQMYPIPTTSPFIGPFNYFVEEEQTSFPKYLTKEELYDIKKEPEKPFLSTNGKIDFSSNKIYAGTMGRPKTKPILAQDIFSQDTNTSASPKFAPVQRQVPQQQKQIPQQRQMPEKRRAPSVASARSVPKQKFVEHDFLNNIRTDNNINSDSDNSFYGGKGKQKSSSVAPQNRNDYDYYSESSSFEILKPQPMQAPRINRRPPSRAQTRTLPESQLNTIASNTSPSSKRTRGRREKERPAPIVTKPVQYNDEYYSDEEEVYPQQRRQQIKQPQSVRSNKSQKKPVQTYDEYEYYSDEEEEITPPRSTRSTRSQRPQQQQKKYRYEVETNTSQKRKPKQVIQQDVDYDYNDEYSDYYVEQKAPSRKTRSIQQSPQRQRQRQEQQPQQHLHRKQMVQEQPKRNRRKQNIEEVQQPVQRTVRKQRTLKAAPPQREFHEEPLQQQPQIRSHSRYQHRLEQAMEETRKTRYISTSNDRRINDEIIPNERTSKRQTSSRNTPTASRTSNSQRNTPRQQKKIVESDYSYDEDQNYNQYESPKGVVRVDARKLHADTNSAESYGEYYYDDEEEEEIKYQPKKRYHYQ
ncbi:Leucine Rich Repeat family protein [Trichomonas vaginalis G3]|uniref:Leucine Rich Repeat family protein n=1 Tax=Trichomonas vaginalis (strain ATCC PRA-98 / G3) TaxID=412133 RepID=A2DTA2_TRIV3|nr:uncharacterized protein TVAGG3_0968140 [Trichomonas vaginalis G3]EAY16374.1 Leucine Rich Repeat family protein [Trichomonas vaginalis G3]KAI5488398.1 leucine-rich repeat, isoform f-related family [Trichomonas vaginalis G3]|eukprot:XP_001328597.1 hypothetical protein [Trichomonas vaginalis G3]